MNKDQKLDVTVGKVQEAAAKCPEAQKTLKALFPAAFREDVKDVKIGDIFYDEAAAVVTIVLKQFGPTWFISGYDHSLEPWSNRFENKEDLIRYINDCKQVYVGNINGEIKSIINTMLAGYKEGMPPRD